MADFVVLSTETIPMYCRILHFSPQCFVTLEVLIRCLHVYTSMDIATACFIFCTQSTVCMVHFK